MMSGVDYSEGVAGCQADGGLFYFVIAIYCFCIIFYKVFAIFS